MIAKRAMKRYLLLTLVLGIALVVWSMQTIRLINGALQAPPRAENVSTSTTQSTTQSTTPYTTAARQPPPLTFDVDPFIGTAGYGHTVPGAKVPFGMIYLTPMSSDSMSWAYTGGYQHKDRSLYGVAHTAVSGTGIRLGLDLVVRVSKHTERILEEAASPGHYFTRTPTASIGLVAGQRYGIHRYTFASTPVLYFNDTVRLEQSNGSCSFAIQSRGHTIWASYPIYLYATANQSCALVGDKSLQFATRSVEVHVAISYVDDEGARGNLENERAPFNTLSARATAVWRRRLLDSYRALNQSAPRGRVFDTALYHMFISPYLHSDADGRFNGPDERLHHSDGEFYTFLSTWDTYRTWGPLMCKIAPDIMRGIVNSSIAHFDITKTFPRWTYAGRETNCMPGMHSITLCYQAAAFGLLSPHQARHLLAALRETIEGRSTFTTTRRANLELRKIVENDGLLYANEGDTQTISQMLEYAIIFACVAKLATRFEDYALAARTERWSLVYRRLYDNRTRLLAGIERGGRRVPDTRPHHASNTFLFTEGSQMHWIFHAMHDLPGLVAFMGGDVVAEYLEQIFTKSGTSEVPDVTGLIGMYAHGNEPSHHLVFMLLLLDKRSRALPLIERIRAMYTTASDGLCGNDDAGQMSAWYVAVSARVYPIDPTSTQWLHF